MIRRLIYAASLLILAGLTSLGQIRNDETCPAPIYGGRDVTKKAKVTKPTNVGNIYEAVKPGPRGTGLLEAVLCRSGRVTDIRVIKGLSSVVDELLIAAVSNVTFTPAELNSHTVSQRMQFEFSFGSNEPGVQIASTQAAGRNVESIDIVGNRRLTKEEIFSRIKSRPGEPYNEQQIKQDFDALLATGFFDKTQTRVYMEEGVRGGVCLVFEVVELPVIAAVVFEGLKIDQSSILEALKKENVSLKVGAPYDAVPIKRAARIIKEVLAASGYGNSTVDPRIEQVSATSVKVIFVITSNQ